VPQAPIESFGRLRRASLIQRKNEKSGARASSVNSLPSFTGGPQRGATLFPGGDDVTARNGGQRAMAMQIEAWLE
jgi:hypothetical protein